MPSRVVADTTAAKVAPTDESSVAAKGAEKPADQIVSTSKTTDKFQTPSVEAPPPSQAPPAQEAPAQAIAPAPSTLGGALSPAEQQITPESGRAGFMDENPVGGPTQFLQLMSQLQQQYRDKLHSATDQVQAQSDEENAANIGKSDVLRRSMRSAEEQRGKDYATFVGEERKKADDRQNEWTQHQQEMADARQGINDFYTQQQGLAKDRADAWTKFLSDQTGFATQRKDQWDAAMKGLTDQQNSRQQQWDAFIANQQSLADARQQQFSGGGSNPLLAGIVPGGNYSGTAARDAIVQAGLAGLGHFNFDKPISPTDYQAWLRIALTDMSPDDQRLQAIKRAAFGI